MAILSNSGKTSWGQAVTAQSSAKKDGWACEACGQQSSFSQGPPEPNVAKSETPASAPILVGAQTITWMHLSFCARSERPV